MNDLASEGATLCQETSVSGLPWISSSGGPEPATATSISAPDVLMRWRLKPAISSRPCGIRGGMLAGDVAMSVVLAGKRFAAAYEPAGDRATVNRCA